MQGRTARTGVTRVSSSTANYAKKEGIFKDGDNSRRKEPLSAAYGIEDREHDRKGV